MSERLRRRPFFAVLLRLSFLTYDPVNYLTGLLGLRVGEFLVANTSGSLPGVIASVRAGNVVGVPPRGAGRRPTGHLP